MIFTLKKVRSHSGEIKDREYRRKGHRVRIERINIEEPLMFEYPDDGNKYVTTSPVEAYNADWKTSGHLIVQTRNSIYVFGKEDE